MSDSRKRSRRDRYDGYYIDKLDPMHMFTPYLLPERCDNEAVMNEKLDMTAVNEYLAKKNADSPEFKYTIFHVICAALAKTLALRPKLNYYIIARRYYERRGISLAFVVKKRLADDSSETLAIVRFDKDSDEAPINTVYESVKKIVYSVRRENRDDGATDIMGVLTKLPRFALSFIINILNFLDYHGWLPKDFLDVDPYHCTAFLSNLGSIKMSASYHHLTNWGTNSLFAVIGEKHFEQMYDEKLELTLREVVELGLTIDERIADGVYFARSVKLLKRLIAEPELLERPLNEPIENY